MTDGPISSEPFSEILHLCTLLADRVLSAERMGEALAEDQVVALAKAARLLQDHGVAWPRPLTQVLYELAGKASEPEPELEVEPPQDTALNGLTRFFAGFRQKDRA